MDYEKKYNEALEKVRPLYEQAKKDGNPIWSTYEFLFPQLCESEDERARKWLVDLVENLGEPADEDAEKELEEMRPLALAYLEKQKENPKSADSIPSNCTSNAKYEDIWHKVSDSLPDNTREVLCKDAIGNYFIGRYYSKGIWEISMYDDCDKSNEDNPPVVMWIDIPSEKQKEQKPISTEDMPYITDEHFYEREPADSFKYKLAEYMTKCCTKKEGPYGYTYGISAEAILKMAEEELLKRGVVQKPAEWNDEDKKDVAHIIRILDDCYAYGIHDLSKTDHENLVNKLKSLRPQPHWKPNKEQMDALKRYSPVRHPDIHLVSLYDDLKKLM